jgi:hypothetical protein
MKRPTLGRPADATTASAEESSTSHVYDSTQPEVLAAFAIPEGVDAVPEPPRKRSRLSNHPSSCSNSVAGTVSQRTSLDVSVPHQAHATLQPVSGPGLAAEPHATPHSARNSPDHMTPGLAKAASDLSGISAGPGVQTAAPGQAEPVQLTATEGSGSAKELPPPPPPPLPQQQQTQQQPGLQPQGQEEREEELQASASAEVQAEPLYQTHNGDGRPLGRQTGQHVQHPSKADSSDPTASQQQQPVVHPGGVQPVHLAALRGSLAPQPSEPQAPSTPSAHADSPPPPSASAGLMPPAAPAAPAVSPVITSGDYPVISDGYPPAAPAAPAAPDVPPQPPPGARQASPASAPSPAPVTTPPRNSRSPSPPMRRRFIAVPGKTSHHAAGSGDPGAGRSHTNTASHPNMRSKGSDSGASLVAKALAVLTSRGPTTTQSTAQPAQQASSSDSWAGRASHAAVAAPVNVVTGGSRGGPATGSNGGAAPAAGAGMGGSTAGVTATAGTGSALGTSSSSSTCVVPVRTRRPRGAILLASHPVVSAFPSELNSSDEEGALAAVE